MQVFSERRSRDSRKPALSECPEIIFYYCEKCNETYTQVGFHLSEKKITCCGEEANRLVPKDISGLPVGYSIDYKIRGGYNDNTVIVQIKSDRKENEPAWICLKTFTGAYTKYVQGKKEIRFALADLDAFVYCDKEPCLECTFRCKRGFSIFVYNENIGLYEIPMDKFSPYWESRS